MGFCVFMLRPDSIYDDIPSERYQFPKQYLNRAKNSVGDWIVYLEPTKVRDTRGYFAIARVEKIVEDEEHTGRFLALIDPGTYLDFANPVPFNEGGGPIERGLINERGKLSGRAQAAVRPISNSDFFRIVKLGLSQANRVLPRTKFDSPVAGFAEDQYPFIIETNRLRVEQLISRPLRDQTFRRVVLKAYDEKCAVTGLKFINGGGRAEVNAAHIQPVEHNGPDSMQNGIALSGTAHWMFDRGLISLSNSLEILVSRQANDIDSVRAFINKNGYATPPIRATDRPHPRFLEWHRENCFKH
jgi:putative restriction endonuclease